jgi:hypothetical protein
MNVDALASAISAEPAVKSGSLRFWGEWFGRPYDNVHRVVRCVAEGDSLVVEFDAGERLTVRSPEGVTANRNAFCIRNATLVRWEWFYHGRPRAPENRYFCEYVRNGLRITASTNVDWYKPVQALSVDENAVEIL